MANIKICDRCGITEQETDWIPSVCTITENMTSKVVNGKDGDYDLCKPCFDKLYDWLKND